jgi:hypothetical protein
MVELKKIFKTDKTEKGNIYILANVFYDKGGMNFFTGRVERRGYYALLTPQERVSKDGFIQTKTTAFSGFKVFISPEEVMRKSKKAYNVALDIYNEREKEFLDSLEYKTGLVIDREPLEK